MAEQRIYTCWHCKRTFSTQQSKDEVLAEMHARFGEIPQDEQESLCDDCHNEYMNRVLSEGEGR